MYPQTAPYAQGRAASVRKRMAQIVQDPLFTRDMWCSFINLFIAAVSITLFVVFQSIMEGSDNYQTAIEKRDNNSTDTAPFKGYTAWRVTNWFGLGAECVSLFVMIVIYLIILRKRYENTRMALQDAENRNDQRAVADAKKEVDGVKTWIKILSFVHGLVFIFLFIVALKSFIELGKTYGREAIDPEDSAEAQRAYDYHAGIGSGAFIGAIGNLLITVWFFMNGTAKKQFFYKRDVLGFPVTVDTSRDAAARMAPSSGYYADNRQHNF